MPEIPISPEELAALASLDGSPFQRRASPQLESRLRRLGLIERSRLSGLPIRTPVGDAVVKSIQILASPR